MTCSFLYEPMVTPTRDYGIALWDPIRYQLLIFFDLTWLMKDVEKRYKQGSGMSTPFSMSYLGYSEEKYKITIAEPTRSPPLIFPCITWVKDAKMYCK